MIQIITANIDQHAHAIRELFWEYLQWRMQKKNWIFMERAL